MKVQDHNFLTHRRGAHSVTPSADEVVDLALPQFDVGE
jgi:hypothetical protein